VRAPVTELTITTTWDGAPLAPTEQVRVRLHLSQGALHIRVDAPLHGDPPPLAPPGPTDRLWEHEVVELFVAAASPAGPPTYTEIELGPAGHHLVLQLRGVRQVVAARLPLRFRSRRRGARWLGAAAVERDLLPPPPWRINAFAIHGEGDGRRYLAAFPLPGPRPDFHQPARFPAVSLAAAR
jgi:hypothetical protein